MPSPTPQLTLISATPSPYARKVRITLFEKRIPFTLQTEVPWDSTTATKNYNPLEKLPVLIPSACSGLGDPVYESSFILEWIEAHFPDPPMLSRDKEKELLAKQVQVISDGICDACVLMFFEKQRDSPSVEWRARQMRKVEGGVKALAKIVGEKEYIVDGTFGLADVAAGSCLGYLRVRFGEYEWWREYEALKRYSDGLEKRESFKDTVPTPQKISDKIV